jgi:plasmid stability protein
MAQLKVRQLDDDVAVALKRRAAGRGVSLEEEVRSTLAASVRARRTAFERRARALRAASGGPGSPALDSARVIRRERDATG